MIQRVALDGDAACGFDEMAELFAGHALRGGGSGVMVDLLFDNGAVEIVGTEAESDLRDFGGHHLPIGLDVGEVVEQQTADGDLANVGEAGGDGQMIEGGVLGVKGQRDEGLEAAGFVLDLAQLEEMVDAVFVVLDVAIEHGGIGAEAVFMGQARGVEPLAAVDLVIADDRAHAGGEDFGAAAGHGIDSRFAHADQGFVDGELGTAGQVRDFNHGEGLDMYLGETHFQAADKIEKIFEGQIGMEAADDVELGDGFGVAGGCRFPGFFEGHGVPSGIAFGAAEGAEAAVGYTDVGGVDVAIDVEVGDVAVQAFADMIGEPAHGQHIACAVECETVFKAQALFGEDFFSNGNDVRIVALK